MFKKEKQTKAVTPTATEEKKQLLFVGKGWTTSKGIILKINADQLESHVKENQTLINKWGDIKLYVGEKKEKGKAGETLYITLMEHEQEKEN